MMTYSVFGQKEDTLDINTKAITYVTITDVSKKNAITVSGILIHFISNKDRKFESNKAHGFNQMPISPGIQLEYMRNFWNTFEIGMGIEYQRGFVSSYLNYDQRRFRFNDISISILAKKTFKLKNQHYVYCTTGLYIGKNTNIKIEHPTSSVWYALPENSTIENFSNDAAYSDLYFDFGYCLTNKLTGFSIAPFFKYRVNTTWLNYHQKKINYGIKLNYSIKL